MSNVVQDAPSLERASKIDLRILLLALGTFTLATDGIIIVGVLPTIAHETRVTESAAGLLVTAFSLVYALGGPILAVLVGRWSRNSVLIGALGVFCLANVGSALSPTFGLLLCTRILAGCCAALYSPLAYTTGISLAPPEKRGQALSLIVVGANVATILGGPLGTWLGEQFGWRISLGLVAVIAGIACMVLLLCGLPKADASPTLSLKTRLAPVREPHLLLALTPPLLWVVGTYAVYTYIAPLLQQNMHISDISGLLIAFGLGTPIGSWLAGRSADRFGANRPLIVGLVALTIIYAIFSFTTTSLIGGILILFIWGASVPCLFIPQQHRLLSLAPEHANVITALNNSALYLGVAIGAALGGAALHYIPATQLGWVGAVCTVLALLMLSLSIRVSEHRRHLKEKSIVG
jgi:predicted MFS family arabinose efflux permease